MASSVTAALMVMRAREGTRVRARVANAFAPRPASGERRAVDFDDVRRMTFLSVGGTGKRREVATRAVRDDGILEARRKTSRSVNDACARDASEAFDVWGRLEDGTIEDLGPTPMSKLFAVVQRSCDNARGVRGDAPA
jgi:hypothetical protein